MWVSTLNNNARLSEIYSFQNHQMQIDGVAVSELVKNFGSPLYVYAARVIDEACHALMRTHVQSNLLPCFAVKANSNLNILRRICGHGLGADVVSVGELERAIRAGFEPEKIVFSGVGKKAEEIRRAISVGILTFNVESEFEIGQIAAVARELSRSASVCLRVNPNIDAKTHPKIATGLYSTKFGMDESAVRRLAAEIKSERSLNLRGISCHIGSQILDLKPIKAAAQRMKDLYIELRSAGHDLDLLDLGGGLGVSYQDEVAPSPAEWVSQVVAVVGDLESTRIILEPGRAIVAKSGMLLTRVIGTKQTGDQHFVIVDAAMTELIRPTLYEAFHKIGLADQSPTGPERTIDVVGPVCETGDFLAQNRKMRLPQSGEILYIADAGAYGMSMASNYNSRPLPAEVMVDAGNVRLIRRRQPLEELWQLEEI
jgi:diaminopimelate decarboxylase